MSVRQPVARGDEVTWSLRAELRRVDGELVAILAERHDLVERLWKHKRESGLPLEDPEQEGRVLARVRRIARGRNLSAAYVEGILRSVIAEGKRRASRSRVRAPPARQVARGPLAPEG